MVRWFIPLTWRDLFPGVNPNFNLRPLMVITGARLLGRIHA
jgi:hypothetical protein